MLKISICQFEHIEGLVNPGFWIDETPHRPTYFMSANTL